MGRNDGFRARHIRLPDGTESAGAWPRPRAGCCPCSESRGRVPLSRFRASPSHAPHPLSYPSLPCRCGQHGRQLPARAGPAGLVLTPAMYRCGRAGQRPRRPWSGLLSGSSGVIWAPWLRRPTGSGPGFAGPPACLGLDNHGMVWSPGPPDGMVMARQQPGASRTDDPSALP